VLEERMPDLRRHPRVTVSWPMTVEMGDRQLRLRTRNLSPFGAKVSLDERLEPGTPAHLTLFPPAGRPIDVDAIVWRADADGPAFFFIGVGHNGLPEALGSSERVLADG
jgi:PilZ domain-containing protein